MLSIDDRKQIFRQAQAIITGEHFVYAKKPDGWFHGPDYVNKDAIYPRRRLLKILCLEIAECFLNRDIDVVVGPTVGAVSLTQWVSEYLDPSVGKEVLAVYADEEDVFGEGMLSEGMGHLPLRDVSTTIDFQAAGKVAIQVGFNLAIQSIRYQMKVSTRRVLKRGYDKLVAGKKCLIVEDVVNSGLTVSKTIKAVSDAGGIIVGVGCLCNRSGGKVCAQTLGVTELSSLLDLDMKMYKEDDCPICKEFGPKSVRTNLGKGKEFLTRKGLA